MATYRGVSYEAGLGPTDSDVVLFASSQPPAELGFEPAPGYWRKRISRGELEALWESRPTGVYRSEPCLVLEEIGDRLHITRLGHDAYRAERLGFWQVDRGVYEVVVPRDEVGGLNDERVDYLAGPALGQARPDSPQRQAGPAATGLPTPEPAPVPEPPPTPEPAPRRDAAPGHGRAGREFEAPYYPAEHGVTDPSGNGGWHGSTPWGGNDPHGGAADRSPNGRDDASTLNGTGTVDHPHSANGGQPRDTPAPHRAGAPGDGTEAGQSRGRENRPPPDPDDRGRRWEPDERGRDERADRRAVDERDFDQRGADHRGLDRGGWDQRGADLGTAQRALEDHAGLEGTSSWQNPAPEGTSWESPAPEGTSWQTPAPEGTSWQNPAPEGTSWESPAPENTSSSWESPSSAGPSAANTGHQASWDRTGQHRTPDPGAQRPGWK